MRADVSPEQPRPGEGLAARGAHAGEGVRPDVHLQGPQAGVLLGAVLAVKGRPGRDLGGQGAGGGGGGTRRRGEVGELVVGQGRCAAVAVAAVEAVVDALGDVRAGRVRGASPVLLLFTAAAAGRGAAEVQRGGRRGRRVDGRERRRQGVRAREKLAVGVTGQGGAVALRWKLGQRQALRHESWRQRRQVSGGPSITMDTI